MSDNTQNNKRIAKNTAFLYIRMIIVLLVSIYTTRVVLNTLGVTDFGVYNVVCGFVSMFSFISSSLTNGIQRFFNYSVGCAERDGVAKVYRTAMRIQIILALIMIVLIETVGIWYINNVMELPPDRLTAANWVFQFSALSFIILIISIPYNAAIIAFEKMDYYAFVSILDTLLKLAIIIELPYLPGDKLIIYGLLGLMISIINFLLNYIYCKRKLPQLFAHKGIEKKLLKSISSFAGWNTVEMFAWITQGQGVNMIINVFFGAVINAARGVSAQIQSAIQQFCTNLVVAIRPQLVESYAQKNYSRTKSLMYTTSKLSFILFYILAIPVILEINYVLRLWLGNNIPDYTASFTILTLISMIPRNFVMALSQVIHATGKMAKYQIASAVVIIFILPVSYIFLHYGYSPIYVYIINLIFCCILFIVCLLVFKTIFEISIWEYHKCIIIPCSVIAIIVPVIPYVIQHFMQESFMRFIIIAITTTITSVIASYLFLLNKSEKEFVKRLIIRKR